MRASWYPISHLKSRLDLGANVLEGILAASLLTPGLVNLCLGEALGLDGWVVAQAGDLADFLAGDLVWSLAVGALVDGDDDGAAETEVVLEGGGGAWEETVVGPATQVPDELSALSDTRGTEWVALGDETSRWVDDHLATVGDVTLADHLVGLARLAEAEGIDYDHLVGGETIVKLADLDVLSGNTGLGHGGLGGVGGHVATEKIHRGAGEEAGSVSGQSLTGDEDGLALKVWAGVKELLGDENSGSTTIAGWAALKLGKGLEDHWRVHDLLKGVFLLELRVWVALAVLVVDTRDLSKVLILSTVLLHILAATVAEQLGSSGSVGHTTSGLHHVTGELARVRTVLEESLEGTWEHLLETNDHDSIGLATSDHGASEVETGATGAAVVVDVVDGNLGHAELVEDTVATC